MALLRSHPTWRGTTAAFTAFAVALGLSLSAATAATPQPGGGNPFADVQPNSWAYQAVQQLASDGLITGYPDGTFKGQRPMTRYEVAVLVNRAVNALETRMASIKPAAPPPPSVSPADLAALRRLVDEFGNELKNVQARVGALEKKTDAMQHQLSADTEQLRFTKVGFSTFARAGSFSQYAQIQSTRPVTIGGVTYAPGTVLPAGISNANAAPGTANVILGAGGAGPSPPDAFVSGQYGHGFAWQDYRLNIRGQIDPRWQYGLRLETRILYSQKNGLAATIPSYCTGAPSAVSGVGCNSQDYAGSAAFALSQGWFGYFSPGGLFIRVGRMPQDSGRFNAQGYSLSGPNVSGVQVGYNDKRLALWGMYELGSSSLTNALAGPGCVTANVVTSTCAFSTGNNGVAGKIDYFFPSSQTDIGGTYNNYGSYPIRAWNPATQLYQTVNSGSSLASAFIAQFFGNRAKPQFRVVAQGIERFGNNPLTGAPWDGRFGFFGELSFASKGNLLVGPLYPGSGIKGSNVFNAQYFNMGLNSQGPGTSTAGTANINNFFFYPNQAGLEAYDIAIERWFTNNLRLGVVYMHWNNKPNVFTPLGSATCPGCYLSALNANALFFDSYIVF